MSIKDFFQTDFGHVKIENMIITCHNCQESSKGLKRANSLINHLLLVSGFVNLHKDCKPGDKPLFHMLEKK